MIYFSGNRQRCADWGDRLAMPVIDVGAAHDDHVPDFRLLLGYANDRLLGISFAQDLSQRRGWQQDDSAWFLPDFSDRRPAPGRDPLLRAIGHQTASLVDCTAGWCVDALHCAGAGMRVEAIERHPVVCALIRQSLDERSNAEEIAPELVIHQGDARTCLTTLKRVPEVVYLDPMYPPKPGSASPKRPMQLLQALQQSWPEPDDAGALLELARRTASRRVVVKRPHHADPLGPGASGSIDARLVRFDLYPPVD